MSEIRWPAWTRRAACAQALESIAIFDNDPRDAARELEALRLCASCPVRPECAAYADEIEAECGIWAGAQRFPWTGA